MVPCPGKSHTSGGASKLMCPMQIRDLNLPIVLCEPVTDMQRRGDFLEYVELLHEVSLPHSSFHASVLLILQLEVMQLLSHHGEAHADEAVYNARCSALPGASVEACEQGALIFNQTDAPNVLGRQRASLPAPWSGCSR